MEQEQQKTVKHILLIEDDQFLLNIMSAKLERESFRLTIAKNGKDALAEIQTSNPDLILLDITLPDINGFELLAKIKATPATSSTPVIILSNLGGPESIKQGMDMGANDYLVKVHYTPQEIIEKIKALLKI